MFCVRSHLCDRTGTFLHTQASLLLGSLHLSPRGCILSLPSHQPRQSHPSPTSLHCPGCWTDWHMPALWAMAQCVPQEPILVHIPFAHGAEGKQVGSQHPASGTGIPPTHHALSHKERQPKVPLSPLLFPHSLMLQWAQLSHALTSPAPGGFAAASQGEGPTGEVRMVPARGAGWWTPRQPRAALVAATSPATLPVE